MQPKFVPPSVPAWWYIKVRPLKELYKGLRSPDMFVHAYMTDKNRHLMTGFICISSEPVKVSLLLYTEWTFGFHCLYIAFPIFKLASPFLLNYQSPLHSLEKLIFVTPHQYLSSTCFLFLTLPTVFTIYSVCDLEKYNNLCISYFWSVRLEQQLNPPCWLGWYMYFSA